MKDALKNLAGRYSGKKFTILIAGLFMVLLISEIILPGITNPWLAGTAVLAAYASICLICLGGTRYILTEDLEKLRVSLDETDYPEDNEGTIIEGLRPSNSTDS